MLVLESGQLLLVRQKGIVAMRDNDPMEVNHEWFCLHLETTENLVTASKDNHLDDVNVDAQSEEGHGTSGAEGAGKNVLGFEY